MDDLPLPSYDDATSRDWVVLIAPYAQPEDLFSCLLVNHHWCAIFTHELWGEPHKAWGNPEKSDERRLGMFSQFVEAVTFAHPDRTANVHSLDLRSLYEPMGRLVSLYKPPSQWLARCFVHLPNLTSFHAVKNLTIDQSSLKTFYNPHYNLQELGLADNDIGVANLGFLLQYLPRLRMVDLQGVKAIKDDSVLKQLCSMEHIVELRLSNVGLQDSHLEKIAHAFGTRLEVLDVRSNQLTDVSVGYLLDYCFRPPDYEGGSSAPKYHSPLASRNGITSLAISNNWKITPEAIQRLLSSGRLQVIDIGHLNIPATGFVSATILPTLGILCKTISKLRIDFRVFTATVENNSIFLPHFDPSAFPCLETLVLEGVPYYIPQEYQLIQQIKSLLTALYVHQNFEGSHELRTLILEISADEDPIWIPEDGSSVLPRFPAHLLSSPTAAPPSFNDIDSDSDDGGWSHVADFGSGKGVMEEYEGQDFSFFNEPYMKVDELREAAEKSPRNPRNAPGPARRGSENLPKKVKKDTGLVDVRKGVEKVIGDLRGGGMLWGGKILFGKWNNEEWGEFI